MCAPCEAASERREAASALLTACERKYGLGPALRTLFPPVEPNADFDELCRLLGKI